MERHKDPRGSRHEQVAGNHRWADERGEAEVENDNCCGASNSHRGVANGDGSHHDGGCIHGREVDPGRSNRQMVDSRLDGMMGASESGGGRYEESRLGSVDGLSHRAG